MSPSAFVLTRTERYHRRQGLLEVYEVAVAEAERPAAAFVLVFVTFAAQIDQQHIVQPA